MHVCTSYFDLKHSHANIFFTLLVVYGAPTKCVERAISD